MNNIKLLSVWCFAAAFKYCIEHTKNNGQRFLYSRVASNDGQAFAAKSRWP